MSYPSLSMTGNEDHTIIQSIKLKYKNDTEDRPFELYRLKHTVIRDFQKKSNSQSTGLLYSSLRYDQVRLIHTWVGYCDVVTQSVVKSGVPDADADETMALIRNAVALQTADGLGILFNYGNIASANLGPNKPSSTSSYAIGQEAPIIMAYSYDDTAKEYILTETTWLVKNISLTDNNNNTTRVTFTFEVTGDFKQLIDILGDVDAE